jgi:hypothetical protein
MPDLKILYLVFFFFFKFPLDFCAILVVLTCALFWLPK